MPIGKNGNGLTLLERFIPDGLSDAATAFVESLKINTISEKRRRGRLVVIKRRNIFGERGADLINSYFRLAGITIRYLSNVRDWRRWEASCFQMLNGDRFRAKITDARTVCLDKLPGQSLWDHMNQGTLNKRMLESAAKEYRRAHQFWRDEFGGLWSHGDASMPNVIYDEKTRRARLIDFEIMHEKSLPATTRHADDLLIFLLDMVDRVPTRQWLPFTTCFVKAYAERDVIAELQKRLVIPRGLALAWWNVRTNFAKTGKVERRLRALRSAISKFQLYRPSPAERPRHRRRASITCQQMSPGIPRPSSRTRAISDRAKAASPGMPRRLPTKR
jgi:hypothetical protein